MNARVRVMGDPYCPLTTGASFLKPDLTNLKAILYGIDFQLHILRIHRNESKEKFLKIVFAITHSDCFVLLVTD